MIDDLFKLNKNTIQRLPNFSGGDAMAVWTSFSLLSVLDKKTKRQGLEMI